MSAAASYDYWWIEPAKSHTDFKIIIKQEDNDTTTTMTNTYHVNKETVCKGECYSNYLRTLLSYNSSGYHFIENDTNSVTIKLNESAANAFPTVLDYLYCDGTVPANKSINTDAAVGVYAAADYLLIEQLCQEVKSFMKEDMSVENSHIYYADAISLNQDFIIREVEKLIAVEYLNKNWNSDFSLLLDKIPDKILDILTVESIMEIIRLKATLQDGFHKYHWSHDFRTKHITEFVLLYIEKHQEELSTHDFHLLTNEGHIPQFYYINESCAMKLIELEEKVCKIKDKTAETSLKKRAYPMYLALKTKDLKWDCERKLLEFLRQRFERSENGSNSPSSSPITPSQKKRPRTH